MAFPSASGTKQFVHADTWQASRNTASTVKQRSQTVRNASAAGPISAKDIIDLATILADADAFFATAAAVPGIQAYVRNQIDDQTFDLAANFTAMRNEIQATVTWIKNNFPKDLINNWLFALTFTAEGRFQWRTLTTAQTAGLRTQLDNLIATID